MRIAKQIFAAMLVVLFLPGGARIQEVLASSTLDKLNQAQQEKRETEEQLKDTQGELNELQGQHTALEGQLNDFNQELARISNNLSVLEDKIKEKEEEIELTRADLEEAKATEEWQYECMKKRIQFLYERGETAFLELLLSSGSYADFLNKTDYINQISQYDRKKLIEYQETKKQIEEFEAMLVSQKEELDVAREQVKEQQSQYSALVNSTQSSMSAKANEISAAEQEALAYEAQIKEQENTIAALRKQYETELALSRLAANSVWRDISQVSFAEGDRTLLATIIYCEAGGESYDGKVAVGSVVINRVLSSRYPDTVGGVIYQNRQFTPVTSGRFAIALAEGRANASCYQAADEAMSGRSNVDNCLYFRTPIEGVVPRYQIGGHIFY